LPKFYFSLADELKYVAKNEVRFTPAVSIMVGLREALRLIEAEGLADVFKRHDRLARATRAGAEALGLELFARATPSPAVTAVVSPKGIDSEKIVAAYSQSHNITIAGGQGEMKGKLFRLGHMGYAAEFDVINALAALEPVLADIGQPVDFVSSVRAAQKIDVASATKRGVVVMNTTGGNTTAVAEHTLALLLALARRLPAADVTLKAGRWEKNRLQGVELLGKILGIVGLGRIGSEVAR